MTAKFTELLGKLETLQKASGDGCDDKPAVKDGDDKGKDKKAEGVADDKKIEAAAADGDKQSDKDKDETFGKAFKVTLPDGTQTDAFDGTEMLKALHTENELLRSTMTDRDTELAKAFDIVVETLQSQRETVSKQAEQIATQDMLIKALQAKVETIGNAGVGRRTMVAIAEKLTPGVGGSTETGQPNKVTAQQVLMKANFMARENKLDWSFLPQIEAHQGRGSLGPPALLERFPELLVPLV